MKSPDFKQIIDRHNTGSVKWDVLDQYLQLNQTDLTPRVVYINRRCRPWVGFTDTDDDVLQQALIQKAIAGLSELTR
ncbi:hypothetical protein ID853_06110 [Xenorhabdus sp. Vera]|nr:hypothetical protein [Xenorhabdus sp. Vera]